MTIGTAKPSDGQLHAVKHYFIDEFPVTDLLTAADFESLALGYLDEIFTTKNTAIVCGGTGLYIKALCEGLDTMPAVSATITTAVEQQYRLYGLEWLQKAVRDEDSEFYKSGEIHNPARLLRALSFVRGTGESILKYRTAGKKERPFRIIKAGLELPREQLYTRINERADMMIADGLVAEAESLYAYRGNKNLQTVGYEELFAFIEGKWTLETAIEKIKQHSRNYAKRQLTWFKKDKEITWFDANDVNVAAKILNLASLSADL